MTVLINCKANPYYNGTKSLDGNSYFLQFHWNTYTSKWYFDIEGQNNDVDVKGIAILPGKDLFAAFGEYQLGTLFLIDNQGANEAPNFDDIGSRFTLEYTPLVD